MNAFDDRRMKSAQIMAQGQINALAAKINRIESAIDDSIRNGSTLADDAIIQDEVRQIGELIKGYVARTIQPIIDHNKRLEARIVKLEARGEVKMCGPWLDDSEYENNNLAVHNGSLWCAKERTKSRPGTDSTWLLVTKQGTFSK